MSLDWLTRAVQAAEKSLDVLANLAPASRLDSTLADALGLLTALADRRLERRCILHLPTDRDGRDQVRADLFGGEIEALGWQVRELVTRPTMDLMLIDGRQAYAVLEGGRSAVFDGVEESATVDALRQRFEELWLATTRGEGEPRTILFEDVVRTALPAQESRIAGAAAQTWDELIARLAAAPQHLYELAPRAFEELIAELLIREGMEVQLTPISRDGGRDILAVQRGPIGQHLYLVECKRYAPENPVGVELVRALYGVVEQERATAGLLVTTSRFTKHALEFAKPVEYRLSLRQLGDLERWLRSWSGSTGRDATTRPGGEFPA